MRRRLDGRWRRTLAWVIGATTGLIGMGGCAERDRLTFATQPIGDGKGPLSFITRPAQDTVVLPGRALTLAGRVTDVDGVDSVYFELSGAGFSFPPIDSNGDTIAWALTLPTQGLSGRTVVLRVFGVDDGGARGQAAVRTLTVP